MCTGGGKNGGPLCAVSAGGWVVGLRSRWGLVCFFRCVLLGWCVYSSSGIHDGAQLTCLRVDGSWAWIGCFAPAVACWCRRVPLHVFYPFRGLLCSPHTPLRVLPVWHFHPATLPPFVAERRGQLATLTGSRRPPDRPAAPARPHCACMCFLVCVCLLCLGPSCLYPPQPQRRAFCVSLCRACVPAQARTHAGRRPSCTLSAGQHCAAGGSGGGV